MNSIKTKALDQFSFSTKLLKQFTKLIPLPSEERDEDYYWKKPKIKIFKYLLEFPETVLLSRIFIVNPSSLKLSIEISNNEDGPYILIADKIKCKQGAMKAINIGFLPCKCIRISTHNAQPFPKASNIKCFGFPSEYILKNHGEENVEILLDKVEEIIYK